MTVHKVVDREVRDLNNVTVHKVVDRVGREPSRLTPPEGVEDFDLENMEVLRTARLYSCTCNTRRSS